MSSYPEHLWEELFEGCENGKNHKIRKFQDEFLGGSSDFYHPICSEMKSLGILKVFCTTYECFMSSRHHFIED